MAQNPLAPPPPSGNGGFDRWMYLLWRRLTQTGQILWASLDFTGSNLTDLATRNHADLQNINTTSYTHLTSTQATDLTDAGDSTLHYHATDRDSANFTGTNWTDLTDAGDSTLHYHATDRARGNHTGTQLAATISDFAAAVGAVATPVTVTDSASVNLTLVGQDITADVLPAGVDHSALGSLNSTSYYHLTQANHTDLTDGNDTTLHYHATDRARANHTGTQTAATISDFDTEVSNNTDVAANTAARHAAVTVTDTTTVDLSLTGQDLSADVKQMNLSYVLAFSAAH